MSKETQKIINAAKQAGKKARKSAKQQGYEFVQFENGILSKIENGHKKQLKEISDYAKVKEEILQDNRIAL
ncbi:MAG: hypothetical protein ABUK01_05330 [Leptospirales bacterium]